MLIPPSGTTGVSTMFGNDVVVLAEREARQTGLSPAVILSQWYTEEGKNALHTATWGKFYNNPAGIKPGNPNVDFTASGRTPGGFDSFYSPQTGADAYASIIEQSNFSAVRQAAVTGKYTSGGKTYNGDMAQIMALSNSGWDAGHYAESGNGIGSDLVANYDMVTGSNASVPTSSGGSSSGTYTPLIGKNLSSTFANWDKAFDLKGLSFSSLWNGSALQDGKALALRAVLFILGIILIGFAIRSFVSGQIGKSASMAEKIAPMAL